MPSRQLLIASPKQAGTAGAGVTLTMTASEPGIVRLDTLCIGAGQKTKVNASTNDLVPWGNVSSILVYNAIELVRGRNTPVPPSGSFSAYRGMNAIRLGDWSVAPGDTIAVSFNDDGDNTSDYEAQIGAAFTPKNMRGGVLEPDGPCTYAGSPVADIAADGQGTCTLTFDEDGIFALSSIQSRIFLDLAAVAGVTSGQWSDASAACAITAITLPSGNAVLIGQNTPALPSQMLAAAERKMTFSKLGAIAVSAGDTVAVTYDNNATDEGVVASFGGRFYPASPVTSASRC